MGDIVWEFDADTETVVTPWGYEDPKTIAQAIADLDTLIANVIVAQTVIGGGGGLTPLRRQYEADRDILDHVQAGGTMRSPYYADLPDWVDKPGAFPVSFDPNLPTYQLPLSPLPSGLTADVGEFFFSPLWNPTLTPALEILKCEGRSATDIVGSPIQLDDGGIVCSLSGWNFAGINYSTAECRFSKPARWIFLSPPGDWHLIEPRTTRSWRCGTRSKTIQIGSDAITASLSGFTTSSPRPGGGYTCGYRFPQSLLNNYSLQLDEIDADPSLSPTTIGHDITDRNTFRMLTNPTGWGVRWVEDTAPRWPLGCDGFKPCWPTFDPDVRMSPRLDQLPVGTPVWVWMNNVSRSCLPTASPPAPGSDCDRSQPSLWEVWPTDETDRTYGGMRGTKPRRAAFGGRRSRRRSVSNWSTAGREPRPHTNAGPTIMADYAASLTGSGRRGAVRRRTLGPCRWLHRPGRSTRGWGIARSCIPPRVRTQRRSRSTGSAK